MKLPELYKTREGKILFWRISVEEDNIITEYGQAKLEGDILVYGKTQRTVDEIKSGKNIGRSNETTIVEQAASEAQSKWEYQINRRGYSQLIKATSSVPKAMLAQDYDDHKKKVKYPCYVQPKLDGIRCLSVIGRMYSRTNTDFVSVPDLQKAINEILILNPDIIALDGELYNHDFKNDFEKITSAVRNEEETENTKHIQYHIYDAIFVEDLTFEERFNRINIIFNNILHPNIIRVTTSKVSNLEELQAAYDWAVECGYEGAMIRNANGLYQQDKRSFDLLKMKEFKDAEAKIIGYEEGRGKLVGHIAAFICEMPNGKRFKAKMKGSLDNLKRYY